MLLSLFYHNYFNNASLLKVLKADPGLVWFSYLFYQPDIEIILKCFELLILLINFIIFYCLQHSINKKYGRT